MEYVSSIASYFSRCQKVTWATKPSGWAFASRLWISARARAGSTWPRATAWKPESQNHWKG